MGRPLLSGRGGVDASRQKRERRREPMASTWWNAKGEDVKAPASAELPTKPGETAHAVQRRAESGLPKTASLPRRLRTECRVSRSPCDRPRARWSSQSLNSLAPARSRPGPQPRNVRHGAWRRSMPAAPSSMVWPISQRSSSARARLHVELQRQHLRAMGEGLVRRDGGLGQARCAAGQVEGVAMPMQAP